jgi:hypothetical protein
VRPWVVMVLAGWCVMLTGSAFAQPAQSPPAPVDLPARAAWHLEAAAGLEAQAGLLLSAALAHVTATPEPWGRRPTGFARRYGHALGLGAAHEGIQLVAGHWLGHDPRYQRRGDGGLVRRVGHAVRGVIASRNAAGRTVPAWPRFAGAFGAGVVSAVWYPEPHGAPRHITEQGLCVLGGDLLSNLWDEFRPDVARRLGR